MDNLESISQLMASHRKKYTETMNKNQGKVLTELADFKHGDVVRVISHERNCGIDQTVFTALVVETKDYGLIVIPQDFQTYIYNQEVLKGAAWETEINWLLENDVEIELLQRF
ncbi:conjugal transfer protein TraF [Enterococcus wangshanyuanii]|uniref:Uncharacterized protein n=1 Tax=Enterococcus wangshanyuanii TaxID=2005703 RepID=A0ABQ1PQW8_9ENTE|nr:conjugal transfer protein TraF [Enterococcus wangshanyuanii]GGD01521.1 hypothetical protein GCM10011573_33900 [Enterococcus wangshanyuanii]